MAITSIQLYVAFSKLFKTTEPDKQSVMQFGVGEAEFDAIDQDSNEYLGIDEALQNNAVSELLYSSMVSAYGSGAADKAERDASTNGNKGEIIDEINLSSPTGNNPFI